MGGWSKRRDAFVRALLDLPLTIVGPGWKKRKRLEVAHWDKVLASQLWGKDVDDLYRSAKIVINVTSWDPAVLTGLNLRVCDVPALGAFLLTDDALELEEFVTRGTEIATFSTPEELREKVLHYLAHEDEREAVTRAGQRRAATGMETYAEKMARVLDAIGMAREGQ